MSDNENPKGIIFCSRDFDFERKILTLNYVEKKGKPRQFRISDKLIAMLQRIRKEKKTVWHGNVNNFRISFAAQKRRLAFKLQNPRIKMIALHTLRHFYACKLSSNERHTAGPREVWAQKHSEHDGLHTASRLGIRRLCYSDGHNS